jgi:hypothetical protein
MTGEMPSALSRCTAIDGAALTICRARLCVAALLALVDAIDPKAIPPVLIWHGACLDFS